MSTVMETHLETQFKEPRTLTLKLSPAAPISEETSQTQIDRPNCWNLMEASSTKSPALEFAPYVHPSSSKGFLSYLSFELCTENLGSESGSDMSDHDVDILSIRNETPKVMVRPRVSRKKVVDSRSFPPPLTTIRGVNPIRVRSKREGGRLVIDAVEERGVCNYFRSDRSDGRLRLSFWDNCSSSTTANVDSHEEQEQEQETHIESAAATAQTAQTAERAETVEEEEEEANVNILREDTIGNNLEIGVEIGNKKFQRSSRCMEGNNNKGLRTWEPLWVAT